jgi:hypothetical protein
VIDDDLAAVAIEIQIPIAPHYDDRVAIAAIVAVANHLALANDVAVTMAGADRHAGRTHAHAHTNFFGTYRQRGSDKRGSRYSS